MKLLETSTTKEPNSIPTNYKTTDTKSVASTCLVCDPKIGKGIQIPKHVLYFSQRKINDNLRNERSDFIVLSPHSKSEVFSCQLNSIMVLISKMSS